VVEQVVIASTGLDTDQAIFIDDRANWGSRLGYVPNAIYPKVAEFLGNYRTLQEMLNEICAINAEFLRRRESLD
jgi:hypothetical protein